MTMNLESMAVDFPRLASHPNRAPFRGVLTLVDTPSDRAPSGAGGHRVILAREAVERALPSLLGMGLDYAPSLDRHDAQRKVGIITEAVIDQQPPPGRAHGNGQLSVSVAQAVRPAMHGQAAGDCLAISGFLYARDFPLVLRELRAQCLGMSYEIAEARVEDLNAPIWRVTDF